ncbi:Uu.00g111130.m01.CDS01 [Anthostomella pinea]|uniref:Uu.00g111130.m01.CDS01 n=1 Tax=Anthostomella pinea TaxID=933095 RepID=A0AAI8YG88_9PEZI|nr:Uu.00g111130.m01.CDS01 [Anthostomella pinea]
MKPTTPKARKPSGREASAIAAAVALNASVTTPATAANDSISIPAFTSLGNGSSGKSKNGERPLGMPDSRPLSSLDG